MTPGGTFFQEKETPWSPSKKAACACGRGDGRRRGLPCRSVFFIVCVSPFQFLDTLSCVFGKRKGDILCPPRAGRKFVFLFPYSFVWPSSWVPPSGHTLCERRERRRWQSLRRSGRRRAPHCYGPLRAKRCAGLRRSAGRKRWGVSPRMKAWIWRRRRESASLRRRTA